MDALTLIKTGLAVWYIVYVTTATHGPGGIFEWAREHLPHGRIGKELIVINRDNPDTYTSIPAPKNGLLDCAYCLMIWVALVLAIAGNGIILDALAAAGLAGLLHGYTGHRFGG